MTRVDIRAALERHWAASDASDFETEHEIYWDDAIVDYPQSGERIRGRRQIQFSRASQPNKKRFSVKRILGIDDLWITELVITYDGEPSYVVSIMEFHGGKVAHETQYFGDAFEPGASRAQWVEPLRRRRIHNLLAAWSRNLACALCVSTSVGGYVECRAYYTETGVACHAYSG
jgi:ketosteroid isomerase-like protein